MLINYAQEKGWEIYNIYSDDDYAGSDNERPQYNILLKDAENKKFDIILCKTQARFTRNLSKVEDILHEKIIEWGIRFVSIVDRADTDDKYNKKSRQINGLVNEWYLEDLSDSIKSVFDTKRRSGLHIGGYAIFGYIRDEKNKGKIIVDERARQIVKKIFDLYENGYGLTEITKKLNEENIPKPTLYKQKYINPNYKNVQMTHNYWTDRTIRRILQNEMYIGNMVQGRCKKVSYKSKKKVYVPKSEWIIVENTHEPIISKEQFYKVQSLLNSRKRATKSGTAHIFAGKLRCADCGSTMDKLKTSNGKYYFKCNLAKSPYKKCKPHIIHYEYLKNLMTKKIAEKINTYCKFEDVAEKLNNIQSFNKFDLLEKDIVKLDKEIKQFNNSITNLYLDKENQVISQQEFTDISSNIRSRKNEKQNEYDKKLKGLDLIKNTRNDYRENKKLIEKYKNFTELNFKIVNDFVDCIKIGEQEKVKKEQTVDIYWNF